MKKLIFIILPLFCLMLACNSNESNSNTTTEITKGEITEKKAVEAPPVKELPKEYPASYTAADLPVWEKATVERANKVQNSSDSRYQLVLRSAEDIHTIAAYYDKEMKARGWTANKISTEAQQKTRRTMTFTKGGNQMMVNALSIPNQEKQVITIMFSEIQK